MSETRADYQVASEEIPPDGPKREEMSLLRRLRSLQPGAHLCIITIDGDGLLSLNILSSGKTEPLKKRQ
jgi:hypothetical protein